MHELMDVVAVVSLCCDAVVPFSLHIITVTACPTTSQIMEERTAIIEMKLIPNPGRITNQVHVSTQFGHWRPRNFIYCIRRASTDLSVGVRTWILPNFAFFYPFLRLRLKRFVDRCVSLWWDPYSDLSRTHYTVHPRHEDMDLPALVVVIAAAAPSSSSAAAAAVVAAAL